MIIKKNIYVLIGILGLSYLIIFLLAPKDVTDYTIADTEYWRETENRLLIKTAYDYNNKDSVLSFPKTLGIWTSFDYKYPEFVYKTLNAEIFVSRGYQNENKNIIWMDIINSKTGESFHKQKICIEGTGWTVDDESIAKFDIFDPSSSTIKKLYTNQLFISKDGKRQIMVYWFMFKKFGFNNSVAMIRLSVPIKNDTTEETYFLMKDFIENELFDAMYERSELESTNTLEYILNEYGNKGLLFIGVILTVLIGMIIYGIRKKD